MLNKEFPINIPIVNENMSIVTRTLRLFCDESVFDSTCYLVISVLFSIVHNMMLTI